MTTDEVMVKVQEAGAKLWSYVGTLETMELGLAGFALVLWLFGRRHKKHSCEYHKKYDQDHAELESVTISHRNLQARLDDQHAYARSLEDKSRSLQEALGALGNQYEALKKQAEAKQMAIEEVVRTVTTVGTRQASSGESVLSEQLRTSGSQVTLAIEALRDVAFQSLQGSQKPPVYIQTPGTATVDQNASTKLLEAVLRLSEQKLSPTITVYAPGAQPSTAAQPGVIPPAGVAGAMLGTPKRGVTDSYCHELRSSYGVTGGY